VGSESLLDDEGEDEMEDEEEQAHDDADSDEEGELPTIPATESINNYAAKELGVELNREIAEKVAEMDQAIVKSSDEDLAGEKLLDLATNSSGSGEQREDRDTAGPVRARLNSVESQTPRSVLGDAVEVDLSGAVRSVRLGRSVGSPSENTTQRQRPTIQVDDKNQDPMSPSRQQNQILLQSDTLELVSVVSSHHEWTAACGVLAFRSDRACAPRVRLPFCGRSRTKVSDEDNLTMRIKAKKALRQNNEKQNAACPSVQRQSSMKSPSLVTTDRLNSKSKFFPADKNSSTTPVVPAPLDDQSANKKVPPSKSLSSPFPMQFRERPKCLQISTEEPNCSSSSSSNSDKEQAVPETPRASGDTMETIASPLPSSPRRKSPTQAAKTAIKGDLPPPCPSGSRRRIIVTTAMTPLKSRKSRRRMRQVKASKENARSTSVLDMEDDEEEDDCDDEEEEEFFDEQEVVTLANVDLLKLLVVADVAYNI
jgi:hypothetical protein